MIGAIGSNSNLLDTISSQYSLGAAEQNSSVTRAEKDVPQESAAEEIKTANGRKYDTVTISPEGAAYARQAAAAKGNQDGVATTAKISDSTITSAAKIATDTAVKSTTATKAEETGMEEKVVSSIEENEETDSLSDYTDSELKQMMYKGDITRSEYDEEMLSRNGFTAEVQE